MNTRSVLRRAGAAAITATLAGGLTVAVTGLAGPAAATGNVASGPVFPAPGNQSFTASGEAVDPGGVSWDYSGFDMSQFSQLAWGPDLADGPISLSMEGTATPADELSYNAGLSNLSAGVLVFSGSTTVTSLSYSGAVATELILTVHGPASGTAPFIGQSALPVPTFNATLPASAGPVGAVVVVPSDGAGNLEMHATAQFLAGSGSVTPTQAASTYFNNLHVTGSSVDALNGSVGAGFYSTPPFGIDQTSVPEAVKGFTYSTTLTATGPDTAPLTWSVTSGTLPAGLTLSSGGVISGTPTTVQSSTFTVSVTDSSPIPLTATQQLTLNVVPIEVTTTSLPAAHIYGKYAATLTEQGGKKAFHWKVSSGSLPPGIKLATSGKLTGAPTALGTYSFTVTVTDSTKPTPNTASANLSITVDPMTVNTSGVPGTATVGQAYKGKLTTDGGKGGKKWSLSSGALPPGLKLASSGALSGKPTLPGSFSFDVIAQDAAKPTPDLAGATVTIVVG
jgi:hypothetical protein